MKSRRHSIAYFCVCIGTGGCDIPPPEASKDHAQEAVFMLARSLLSKYSQSNGRAQNLTGLGKGQRTGLQRNLISLRAVKLDELRKLWARLFIGATVKMIHNLYSMFTVWIKRNRETLWLSTDVEAESGPISS